MAKKKSATEPAKEQKPRSGKRSYVSQADLPKNTLSESLRLAQSLWDDFAGKEAQPHQLAMSVDLSPTSSLWRDLCGASLGYGLTEGGCNAKAISLTDLGRRIVAPEEEGNDVAAKAEAVLRPRICGEFFRKYNKAKFPSDKIAENVLVGMDVPKNRASAVVELLKHNGETAGIIHQTKTGPFVAIDDPQPTDAVDDELEQSIGEEVDAEPKQPELPPAGQPRAPKASSEHPQINRVFISHGKDRSITTQIKEILTFGKFEAVVSVEKESTAIPVPEKVFQDMRSCAAAVIHVVSEGESLAPNGDKVHRLNENVLIEIGAAIALCDKNVVLLVEKGTPLPSNLQGLYRCEYEGDKLDYEATMKLLKTFNEFHMGGN